jgi:hypothetical protein
MTTSVSDRLFQIFNPEHRLNQGVFRKQFDKQIALTDNIFYAGSQKERCFFWRLIYQYAKESGEQEIFFKTVHEWYECSCDNLNFSIKLNEVSAENFETKINEKLGSHFWLFLVFFTANNNIIGYVDANDDLLMLTSSSAELLYDLRKEFNKTLEHKIYTAERCLWTTSQQFISWKKKIKTGF